MASRAENRVANLAGLVQGITTPPPGIGWRGTDEFEDLHWADEPGQGGARVDPQLSERAWDKEPMRTRA